MGGVEPQKGVSQIFVISRNFAPIHPTMWVNAEQNSLGRKEKARPPGGLEVAEADAAHFAHIVSLLAGRVVFARLRDLLLHRVEAGLHDAGLDAAELLRVREEAPAAGADQVAHLVRVGFQSVQAIQVRLVCGSLTGRFLLLFGFRHVVVSCPILGIRPGIEPGNFFGRN